MTERHFDLPKKIDGYLAVLNRLYEKSGDRLLRMIVVNGAVSVHEEWDYDNWNGGTYGHAVTLTLPQELYLDTIDAKDDLQRRISEDLNKLNNTRNEFISAVFLEMQLVGSDQWRERTSLLQQRPLAASPSDVDQLRIWGEQRTRIFLSHRSGIKLETSALKKTLVKCGIAGFVAHEDIEPSEEWHREIEIALNSMDALVALSTEDYHESSWTDQEIGFALGRGVPVISVRLGCDPRGLLGRTQAITGCSLDNPEGIVIKVLQFLHRRHSDRARLFESAVSAYAAAKSFDDSAWTVRHALTPFEALNEHEVERVLAAYRSNYQNHGSFKSKNLLHPLLEKWTGKKWVVKENSIVLREGVSEPEASI